MVLHGKSGFLLFAQLVSYFLWLVFGVSCDAACDWAGDSFKEVSKRNLDPPKTKNKFRII